MESMVITPKNESAMAALQSFLKGMQGAFTSRAASETLEGRITGLYEQGHYTDSELKWFFSIPKKHRVDPFEVSPSGDVYWADKRNVEELERRSVMARREKEEGRLVKLDTSSFESFLEGIRAYGKHI